METRVFVSAENPVTGERTHTNTAYLVYVAIDDKRRPRAVPRLYAENEAQAKHMEAGISRQAYRLSLRGKSKVE
jgi:acyl-CoA hydrolase